MLETEMGKGTTVSFSLQVRDEQKEYTSDTLRRSTTEMGSKLIKKIKLSAPKTPCLLDLESDEKKQTIFYGNVPLKKELEVLHTVALKQLSQV